jgi:hypothetical protein
MRYGNQFYTGTSPFSLSTIGTPGTITIRLKVGAVTLTTLTVTPTASLSTASGIVFGYWQVVSAGTSGTVNAQIYFNDGSNASGSWASSLATAVDTTVAGNVDLTWQWATANAGNTATVNGLSGDYDKGSMGG